MTSILLVGEKRVGKTTLCNFLNGADFQLIADAFGRYLEQLPEVDQAPNFFQIPRNNLYRFIEVPNFDMRDEREKSLLASNFMRTIAEEMEEIQLLACVTKENDVRDRGNLNLRATLTNIGRMMMQNNLENTMLVVTQSFVENDRLETRENQLYNILKAWRDQGFAQPIGGQGLDVDERKAIQYVLNIICSDPSRVAIIRADHPEDRERFESRLNQMQAVDVNEYNFAHILGFNNRRPQQDRARQQGPWFFDHRNPNGNDVVHQDQARLR